MSDNSALAFAVDDAPNSADRCRDIAQSVEDGEQPRAERHRRLPALRRRHGRGRVLALLAPGDWQTHCYGARTSDRNTITGET